MEINTLNVKRSWLTVLSILTVVLILPIFSFAGTLKEKMPSTIGLATWGQGSKGYVIITAISHAIEKQTGIKVRVIPAVTGKARLMSVIRREALAANVGLDDYVASGGILEWLEEGPQSNMMLWAGAPGTATLVVRVDSGIKTWKDIRGKRVADCRKISPAVGMLLEGLIAYGGLTFDDVISVPLVPFSVSTRALIDGATDVAFDANSTPAVMELAASPHGAYFLQTPPPPDDNGGWKRFWKVCPVYRPYAFTYGVNASEANPMWFPASCLHLVCHPDASEKLVYTVVKAIDKGYDLFKDAHGECPQWNIDNALDLNLLRSVVTPYHPGAIRYFKEIGRWTEKHEKWQQSRIEFQQKVRQTREQTIDEAIEKGIGLGKKKFENLWRPKWDRLASDLAMKEF